VVVRCTHAGSGRTFRGQRRRDAGVLISDNLTPQKARVLALALTRTTKHEEIEGIFLTYWRARR
jgi:L-asparaginase